LSGRGLCNEVITRPEEPYRLWCVVVSDLETSKWGHDPRWDAAPQKKPPQYMTKFIQSFQYVIDTVSANQHTVTARRATNTTKSTRLSKTC